MSQWTGVPAPRAQRSSYPSYDSPMAHERQAANGVVEWSGSHRTLTSHHATPGGGGGGGGGGGVPQLSLRGEPDVYNELAGGYYGNANGGGGGGTFPSLSHRQESVPVLNGGAEPHGHNGYPNAGYAGGHVMYHMGSPGMSGGAGGGGHHDGGHGGYSGGGDSGVFGKTLNSWLSPPAKQRSLALLVAARHAYARFAPIVAAFMFIISVYFFLSCGGARSGTSAASASPYGAVDGSFDGRRGADNQGGLAFDPPPSSPSLFDGGRAVFTATSPAASDVSREGEGAADGAPPPAAGDGVEAVAPPAEDVAAEEEKHEQAPPAPQAEPEQDKPPPPAAEQPPKDDGPQALRFGDVAADEHGIKRSLLAGRELRPAKWPSGEEVLQQPYAQRVIVNRDAKLLYCPIPTAVSSNWKLLLRKFAGQDDFWDLRKAHNRHASGLKYLDELAPNEVEQLMGDPGVVRFTFTRHPYLRVLSGFINKYLHKETTSHEYYVFMGHLYGWDWLEKHEHELGTMARPTFEDFLKVVTAADNDNNEHWGLQTSLCGIGHFPYDFVGKMDSVEDDTRRVLEAVGRGEEKFPSKEDLQFVSSGAKESFDEHAQGSVRELLHKRYKKDLDVLGFAPL